MVIFGNPILQRELRLISRNWRVPLALTFVGTAAAGLALLYLAVSGGTQTGAGLPTHTGVHLFSMLATGQLLLILLLAPGLTAGALSGERERQTLEPLWQSGLPASALVVGKLGGALAYLFLLVLVTTPSMGLLLLLGGVHLRQVGLVYAILLATGLLLACLGLCASAMARRTQAAATGSYVLTAMLVTLTSVPVWVAGPSLIAWKVPAKYLLYAAAANPVTALAASTGGPFFAPVLTGVVGPLAQGSGGGGGAGAGGSNPSTTTALGITPTVNDFTGFIPPAYASLMAANAQQAGGRGMGAAVPPAPKLAYGFLGFSGGAAVLLLLVATLVVRPPAAWGLGSLFAWRRRRMNLRQYEEGGVRDEGAA